MKNYLPHILASLAIFGALVLVVLTLYFFVWVLAFAFGVLAAYCFMRAFGFVLELIVDTCVFIYAMVCEYLKR